MEHIFLCRSCGANHLRDIINLGMQPLANSLKRYQDLGEPEDKYPLTLAFCGECSLVQIRETVDPKVMFSDYLYFSSVSDAFVEHSRRLADEMVAKKELGPGSLVMEAASNDGYLLKHYVAKGIPVLGIDPAANIVEVARRNGVETNCDFFTEELAERYARSGKKCDVFHANNVLAHVPDLNGFVAGIRKILKPNGVAVIEVPYLGSMIPNCEFDTIYHEHLCYFSFTALERLFNRNKLSIVDVKEIPVHGGSLRIYAEREEANTDCSDSVIDFLSKEAVSGMGEWDYYADFSTRVNRLGFELWRAIAQTTKAGGSIAAYGASAKGSTLINYFGIDERVLTHVEDRSPHKQGLYMPGTRLLITDVGHSSATHYLLLTWNFLTEIVAQNQQFMDRGGKFIVPIPSVQIIGGRR